MMFRSVLLPFLCAYAVAQVVAQDSGAEGLLSQMAPAPAPAKVEKHAVTNSSALASGTQKSASPAREQDPLFTPVTSKKQSSVYKPAPLMLPRPADLKVAAPTVDAPKPAPLSPLPAEIAPPRPVAVTPRAPVVESKPTTTVAVTPEEVKPAPAVAATALAPLMVAQTNKPTVTLPQPKKRGGGSSLLSRAGSSTNAPLRETLITSEKIDFDNREGVILFDDRVLVDDPQFVMRSDRLLVFMESTNDVSQVMAIGNVVFSNEMRSATCDKAVYTRKDGQVVLSGDVRLKTEGETAGEVRGKRVVIWVDDERVEVLDGASVTLPPGTFKKASEHEKKDPKSDKKNE